MLTRSQDDISRLGEIDRRELLVALSAAATAIPLAALAQARPTKRLGMLVPFEESDPLSRLRYGQIEAGLADRGWVKGQTLSIDYRWYAGDPTRAAIGAMELAALPLDAVVVGGNRGLAEVVAATRTIPVVFITVTDPVAFGFVSSLAKPGGNVTGFGNYEFKDTGKLIDHLRQIQPATRRAAIMYFADSSTGPAYFRGISATALSDLEISASPIRSGEDIEAVFRQQAATAGVIVCPPDTILHNRRAEVILLAQRYRVPTGFSFLPFVQDGGLLSYAADSAEGARGATEYVDRIFRGEKPGDMPVQLPNNYQLAVNLTAARGQGLVLPPSLLAQADIIVE